ncbi:MAG TPA: hypothetical protein VKR32_02460 [Puia sp.]|nr:hypothetical protein [Puia sp.]
MHPPVANSVYGTRFMNPASKAIVKGALNITIDVPKPFQPGTGLNMIPAIRNAIIGVTKAN